MSAVVSQLELDVAPDALIEVFASRDRVGLDAAAGLSSLCVDLCPQTAHDLAEGLLRSALGVLQADGAGDGAIVTSPGGHDLTAEAIGAAVVLTLRGARGSRVRIELSAPQAVRVALALYEHADVARQRARIVKPSE